jgi:pyrroloquinoline quinone biosynthesis protein B
MRVKLLGSAAGGGFPQWNCSCDNCRALREGRFRGSARTQSSLAVSPDGDRWFLLNASPDLRAQIEANPELQPKGSATRHSPIHGAVVTNADLDHVLGLLLMRESQPLRVHATPSVRRILTEDNTMFRMLDPAFVSWTEIRPGEAFELAPGLRCTPWTAGRGFPKYVEPARAAGLVASEAVLALLLEDTRNGRKMAYLPGIPALDETWLTRLSDCDLLFCDGTFWTDDELKRASGATRSSREMGHVPMSGPDGSIEWLARLSKPVKVLAHVNNTNPALDESGPEFRALEAAGLRLGKDGMEFEL